MSVTTEPCGGCGEPDPKKACIGCLHFHAPTTRETVNHTELTRLRQHIANLKLRPGHHVQFGTPSVSQISNYWNRDLADDLDALLSEIAALRGEVERLASINVDHCSAVNTYVISNARLDDRLTQAERQRDELLATIDDVLPSDHSLRSFLQPGSRLCRSPLTNN